MQKIKYLIFAVLILSGLIFSGELYQGYMDSFNHFYTFTCFLNDASRDTMLSDIEQAAERNHVQVFMQKTDVENLFTKTITIYGNEDTIRTLKSDFFMREGSVGSIFCGSTTVVCHGFYEIPDEMLQTGISGDPTFSVIGTLDDARQMKSELENDYGGHFPQPLDYNPLTEKKRTVLAIWLIILILICFISFYSLALNQREFMTRCTLGESRFGLFGKIVLSDTAFLILWFAFSAVILQHFSNVLFLSKYTVPMLLLCVLFNILVNCLIFHFKVKEAFSNISGRKTLITGAYVVKTLTCILTTLVLTFQATTIKAAISFYQQKKFFKEHASYNYITLLDKQGKGHGITHNIYYKYADKILILDPMYDLKNSGEGGQEERPVVFANEKAYEVLREWMPELDSLDTDADICLIKPSGLDLSDTTISFLTDHGDSKTVKFVDYQEKSKIIMVEEDFLNRSEWYENPIIVLEKNDHKPLLTDEEINERPDEGPRDVRLYNYMIDVPEDELKAYVEHYGDTATITSIYDYYLYRLEILKRSLYLSIVFIVLILALEIYISIMIIRLEYKVNAIELAVKKTLGYGNFERLKKLYLLTGICVGISFIASMIIIYFIQPSSLIAPVIAIAVIALIEFFIVRRYAVKYEQKNIPEILKGSNV